MEERSEAMLPIADTFEQGSDEGRPAGQTIVKAPSKDAAKLEDFSHPGLDGRCGRGFPRGKDALVPNLELSPAA